MQTLGVRRFVMSRFPYALPYLVMEEQVGLPPHYFQPCAGCAMLSHRNSCKRGEEAGLKKLLPFCPNHGLFKRQVAVIPGT